MNTEVHYYVGFALEETPVDRLHDLCSIKGLFSCIPFMTDEISILLQDSYKPYPKRNTTAALL
jgi:hypothetical protein